MCKLCCINPELTLQIFLQQTVLHPSPNIYISHLQSFRAIRAILSGCKKHQQIRLSGSIGATASSCLCQICGGPPVKPVGCSPYTTSEMHAPNTGIQLPPQCARCYNRDIVYMDSRSCHKSKNSTKVIKAAICGTNESAGFRT